MKKMSVKSMLLQIFYETECPKVLGDLLDYNLEDDTSIDEIVDRMIENHTDIFTEDLLMWGALNPSSMERVLDDYGWASQHSSLEEVALIAQQEDLRVWCYDNFENIVLILGYRGLLEAEISHIDCRLHNEIIKYIEDFWGASTIPHIVYHFTNTYLLTKLQKVVSDTDVELTINISMCEGD